MAMSQRSTGSFRGGRGGFTLYGRQRQQRTLPQPRPFRPPAPVTPPPPSEETFDAKGVTEELHGDAHSPSFLIRLLLPGFTRLEDVKITNGTGPESNHAVRVHGERFDSPTNTRFRFDTTFAIPPDYDVSPPVDAKLESGTLIITFPRFSSSSSSSSSSWNSSESQTESQSSSGEESPLPPAFRRTPLGSPLGTDHDHGDGGKRTSGKNVVENEGKKKAVVDQERGEMGGHDRGDGKDKLEDYLSRSEGGELKSGGEKQGDVEVKKESLLSVRGRDDGDHGGGGKSTSQHKEEEEEEKKAVDQERGERATSQSQLVANMGAAAAVVVALGAYTYYFTFA